MDDYVYGAQSYENCEDADVSLAWVDPPSPGSSAQVFAGDFSCGGLHGAAYASPSLAADFELQMEFFDAGGTSGSENFLVILAGSEYTNTYGFPEDVEAGIAGNCGSGVGYCVKSGAEWLSEVGTRSDGWHHLILGVAYDAAGEGAHELTFDVDGSADAVDFGGEVTALTLNDDGYENYIDEITIAPRD